MKYLIIFLLFSATSALTTSQTSNSQRNKIDDNLSRKHILNGRTCHVSMSLHGLKKKVVNMSPVNIIAAAKAVSAPAVAATSQVGAKLLAKLLGYAMVIGSMTVYTPILINLLKSKSSEGFSTQTWIFNLIGLSMAATYPIQKQFALSSYLEIVVLSLQSLIILGIILHYNNQDKEFFMSILTYGLYFALIMFKKLPDTFLQPLSLISSLICNYANIPQIVLTYTTKKAKWSRSTGNHHDLSNIMFFLIVCLRFVFSIKDKSPNRKQKTTTTNNYHLNFIL